MSGDQENTHLHPAVVEDVDALENAIAAEGVNAPDADGWTPLHIAARTGDIDVVRDLIAQPIIDVNVKNRWKSTPLMIAAGSGSLEIVELLLRHPRTQVDLQAEYYGRTALIEASLKGHLHVVKALVMHGANINATDKTGRNSALIEAIKHGHINVATFLLRSGLVDFSQDDHRRQALIWAGSRGGDVLRAELDAAIANFFRSTLRAAS